MRYNNFYMEVCFDVGNWLRIKTIISYYQQKI